MDERIEQARLAYEQAVFGGDPSALDPAQRALDVAAADIALARGRILHARFLDGNAADGDDARELELFEQAARAYQELGEARGGAEALFWIGCFLQVVWRRGEEATALFEQSAALAARAGDPLTLSYAMRHLGISAQAKGQLDAARTYLEESTRLRRELGFEAGVAANLIGLAFVAKGQDRRDDAIALIDQAISLSESCGAWGIHRSATGVRADIVD